MNILPRMQLVLAMALCVGAAAAQTPAQGAPSKPLSTSLSLVVFPAKGQTPTKQSADEGECYAWSKGQTGIDPFAPAAPQTAAAAPAASTGPVADGSRVKGALRGAAAGAVIGEVANNDAGKGAGVGATVGVLAGGAQSRRNQQAKQQQAEAQQQQQAQQQQAAKADQLALFNKGFSACLEARGYTVK
jgi:uncharacterized protein YcfJ